MYWRYRHCNCIIVALNRYVLRPLVPAKEEWTSVFKEQFLKGFKVFLELLQLLEGVDGVVRQRGEHVASEVSWEPALSLWCSMQPVFLQIIKWCQADVSLGSTVTHL